MIYKELYDLICGIDEQETFARNFDCFLDFSLSFFNSNPTDEQRAYHKSMDYSMKERLLKAFECYGKCSMNYSDALGDMFLEIRETRDQTFTPSHVADVMSEMACVGDGCITDLCCGSGRLLLSAIKVSRSRGFEPIVRANDISAFCAKMCLLNMCINSVCGCVSVGDASTDTFSKRYEIERFSVLGISFVHFFEENL